MQEMKEIIRSVRKLLCLCKDYSFPSCANGSCNLLVCVLHVLLSLKVLQHFEPSLVNAIKKYGDPKYVSVYVCMCVCVCICLLVYVWEGVHV